MKKQDGADALEQQAFDEAKERLFAYNKKHPQRQGRELSAAYGDDGLRPRGRHVVVESFNRLARNVKDLLALTDEMVEKGVDFVSLKETTDANMPAGKAMLTSFGAISQFERDYIRERQQEGIALRKARKGYQGRPPIQVPEAVLKAVYDAWRAEEMTARQAMLKLGLKPNTFYRRVKKYEAKAHEEESYV